jgi:hypothetical protein
MLMPENKAEWKENVMIRVLDSLQVDDITSKFLL